MARVSNMGSDEYGGRKNRHSRPVSHAIGMWLMIMLVTPLHADADTGNSLTSPADVGVFAIIGSERISREHYEVMYRALARERFFHGGVPPERAEEFDREVERTVIDRTLLLQEVRRRGYQPRQREIEKRIEVVEMRNAQSPGWLAHREVLVAQLRSELEENDLLAQLEADVKRVPAPSETDTRGYYDTHRDRFVTPARARVSLILLGVEPWAKAEAWQEQTALAQQIAARVRAGEDFAVLARKHSTHESAARGGDLGLVHQGMLAAEAQRVLDGLLPGQVSDPLRLLQGIAVFRLDERIAPVVNDYNAVRARAEELLGREREDDAWSAFVQGLRERTPVEIIRPDPDIAPERAH